MSDDRRRVRRLQVLAGILIGLVVGTAHALVTHVVGEARREAVTRSWELVPLTPEARQTGVVDAAAR